MRTSFNTPSASFTGSTDSNRGAVHCTLRSPIFGSLAADFGILPCIISVSTNRRHTGIANNGIKVSQRKASTVLRNPNMPPRQEE